MSALESYTVTQPRSMAQSQDKLCDPTLEKSHLHESQVTINCRNGQLKETQYREETAQDSQDSQHCQLLRRHTQSLNTIPHFATLKTFLCRYTRNMFAKDISHPSHVGNDGSLSQKSERTL